ncbi:DUF6193 family natural product biosynthesis protein [Streptomyces sp. N2A]|uniref:DUF6193 family natural product biosynthesis protein n=1 Tax=Streptomyces sp. N2A TaxID=3073936 RepID=UPI00287081C4|nr:DUF6193 family natural product biosynthesis protein [Streptomyces sp. N2A]
MDSNLYPDLMEAGGLAAAMVRAAREHGIDLGSVWPGSTSQRAHYVSAVAESDRGPILVGLGAEKRWFSISIEGDLHPWASGGTDSLVSVVRVLDSWRSGATLQELNALFPFMCYGELEEARERGDVVATQWRHILAEGNQFFDQSLLCEIHSHERLRELFPFFSHGILRIARDHTDRRAGEIWITPLRSGAYRVEDTAADASREVAQSPDQVISAVMDFLDMP